MATTAMQDFLRRIKGVSVSKLKDTATGKVLHLPNYDFVLNPGQEIQVLDVANAIGSMGYAGYTVTAEKPNFEITFKQNAPEVIEMITGYKFEESTNYESEYSDQFTIGSDGTIPAVTAGQLGDTIIEDDPGVSVTVLDADFNYSQPLTRVAFATGPASATEFSVGESRNLVFHSSLAGKNASMTVNTTFASVLKKSETSIGTYDLRATVILADSSKLALISANNCEVQLGEANFNPTNPETAVKLFPIADLGRCAAYDFLYINKVASC